MHRIKVSGLAFAAVLVISALGAASAAAKTELRLIESEHLVAPGTGMTQELQVEFGDEQRCEGEGGLKALRVQGSTIKMDEGSGSLDCEGTGTVTGGIGSVTVAKTGKTTLAMGVAEGRALLLHENACTYEVKKFEAKIFEFNDEDLFPITGFGGTAKRYKSPKSCPATTPVEFQWYLVGTSNIAWVELT
jgi:hypothetical protein